MTNVRRESSVQDFRERILDMEYAIQNRQVLDKDLYRTSRWSWHWIVLCIKNLFCCKDLFKQFRMAEVALSLKEYVALNQHYLFPRGQGIRPFPTPLMKLSHAVIGPFNRKTRGRHAEILNQILDPLKAQIKADEDEAQRIEDRVNNVFVPFEARHFHFNQAAQDRVRLEHRV